MKGIKGEEPGKVSGTRKGEEKMERKKSKVTIQRANSVNRSVKGVSSGRKGCKQKV